MVRTVILVSAVSRDGPSCTGSLGTRTGEYRSLQPGERRERFGEEGQTTKLRKVERLLYHSIDFLTPVIHSLTEYITEVYSLVEPSLETMVRRL